MPPRAGSSTAEALLEAVFYFDLASPSAYLAGERIQHVLGAHGGMRIEWQPVLARDLPGAQSSGWQSSGSPSSGSPSSGSPSSGSPSSEAQSSEAQSPRHDSPGASAAELRAALELRASRQGALPLRWPPDFPFDSEQAMLVATYAKSIGRATAFAQAAFRQAFAGGRSLALTDNVVIAAAACELHPAAVLRGAGLESVRRSCTQRRPAQPTPA